LPRRPAGIIDGTTLPPAGLEVSFLPSTGFDIGAAARDPLFILHPLFMLPRQWRLVVGLYLDVDQQQGPYHLVLVEVALRLGRGPHLLLEVVGHLALVLVLLASLALVLAQMPYQ
jgi:hypothetical protein